MDECHTDDRNHNDQFTSNEKIAILKNLIRAAIQGDFTRDQLGYGWHEEAEKALKL